TPSAVGPLAVGLVGVMSWIGPVMLIVPVNGATQRRMLSISGDAFWAAACRADVTAVRPPVFGTAADPSRVGPVGPQLRVPLASTPWLNSTVVLTTRSGRPSPFTSLK